MTMFLPGEYGTCQCGGKLLPIWCTEEERIVSGGIMTKTGRTRRACSHLTCESCMKNECVDDTFDEEYR